MKAADIHPGQQYRIAAKSIAKVRLMSRHTSEPAYTGGTGLVVGPAPTPGYWEVRFSRDGLTHVIHSRRFVDHA